MMAYIWVVWNEGNERIFNHKANFVLSLLDSIFFLDLRAGTLASPLKNKVDLSVITLCS